MQKHIVDEKTGISYTLIGDYYLPWGDMPDNEPEQRPIGIWGKGIYGISNNTAVHLMRQEQLQPRTKRARTYSSYKGEITPAVPNIISRNFHAEHPNEKWLTDITEFAIPAGKVYLSPIIDCFDGMPVCWTVGVSPNAELVNL